MQRLTAAAKSPQITDLEIKLSSWSSGERMYSVLEALLNELTSGPGPTSNSGNFLKSYL